MFRVKQHQAEKAALPDACEEQHLAQATATIGDARDNSAPTTSAKLFLKTNQCVWPSSLRLATYLSTQRQVLFNKKKLSTVIELGIPSSVLMCHLEGSCYSLLIGCGDFAFLSRCCMEILQADDGSATAKHIVVATDTEECIRAKAKDFINDGITPAVLDWARPSDIEALAGVVNSLDLLLAADVLYKVECFLPLANTISSLLKDYDTARCLVCYQLRNTQKELYFLDTVLQMVGE